MSEILGEGPTDEADAVYITVDLIGLEITGGYLADRIAEEDAEAILPVGAGIFARYANLTLVDCAIAENTILSEERVAGAGLYAEYSQTLTIRRTEVAENSAEGEIVCGAGASLFHCQSIVITDSVFVKMRAPHQSTSVVRGGDYRRRLAGGEQLFVFNSAMGIARSLGGGFCGSVQLTNTRSVGILRHRHRKMLAVECTLPANFRRLIRLFPGITPRKTEIFMPFRLKGQIT